MVHRPLTLLTLAGSALAAVMLAYGARAQAPAFERLPAELIAVTPPSERVTGEPGTMRIAASACSTTDEPGLRRRILDIVVQEWGYFGFPVVDETAMDDDDGRDRRRGFPRGFSWLGPSESARVAASIAGYWASTRDGSWILERQNGYWNGPEGVAARWRDPWSAAFISWVMCESGLGSEERFRRHIAHHVYIDQAIEARDDPDSAGAFVAYDVGETAIEPGDMVCRARRAVYRTIAERRRALGEGVRSHCDIVVAVEPERDRILAIGGNVRGRVSLKLLPATFEQARDEPIVTSIGRGRRVVFAHLKLRAPSVEAEAFENTPTLRAFAASNGGRTALELAFALAAGAAPGAPETPLSGGSAVASP